MPSRSSTSPTRCRSARVDQGSQRSLRTISTHSATVTGKVQLTVSSCGT